MSDQGILNILVVGGTGHIGSYLVPRLALAGHRITVMARNPEPRYPYRPFLWDNVERIAVDRRGEEAAGKWVDRMARVETDVVIDLISFTPDQNRVMMDAFDGRMRHFLHCGTIWSYGPSELIPYREEYVRRPIGDYGIQKAQIEADLENRRRETGFPYSIAHPGHICGVGWLPIDPQGTRNGTGIYRKLARGEEVLLPHWGMETLHHVHADDVAQMFERCIANPGAAMGESFSTVAPQAVSLKGCCEIVARMFGRQPNLRFVSYEEFEADIGTDAAATTRNHMEHSPCSSIEKAQRLLGYAPRYTTTDIFAETLEHLLKTGDLDPT